jgi:hypothetical protein
MHSARIDHRTGRGMRPNDAARSGSDQHDRRRSRPPRVRR